MARPRAHVREGPVRIPGSSGSSSPGRKCTERANSPLRRPRVEPRLLALSDALQKRPVHMHSRLSTMLRPPDVPVAAASPSRMACRAWWSTRRGRDGCSVCASQKWSGPSVPGSSGAHARLGVRSSVRVPRGHPGSTGSWPLAASARRTHVSFHWRGGVPRAEPPRAVAGGLACEWLRKLL